jgi:DNA-binding response OmpR family regulator
MQNAPKSVKSSESGNKPMPRAALLHLDDETGRGLRDAFKQFGVQTIVVEDGGAARLQKEKFEAIVLRLVPGAEELLTAARNSPSNRRVVVYGLAKTTAEAMRFSQYGINAVVAEPIERQAVLKVVRATYLLVIHELRRYVRIPIVTPLKITYNNRTHEATTVEISAGGMCANTGLAAVAKEAEGMELLFELPGIPKIKVNSGVCWRRERDNQLGLRFDSADDRRLAVRRWIDDYLESL